MKEIKDLLIDIQSNGVFRNDRTGTGIQSVFGRQIVIDLKLGQYFPAITLRKFPLKTILHELLWFIQGTDKCDYLDNNNVKIWKQWTEPNENSVGKMYGVQLRNRPSYVEVPNNSKAIDYHLANGYQIVATSNEMPHLNQGDYKFVLMYKKEDVLQNLIEQLKENPNSRRHVLMIDENNNILSNDNLSLSLWNHDYLPDEKVSPIENVVNGRQALANCHGTMIQFNVNPLTIKQIVEHLNHLNADNQYGSQFNQFVYLLSNSNQFLNQLPNEKQHDIIQNIEKEFDISIPKNGLSLQMYQRSSDVPTAIGFNIGQYALLLYMVAHLTNMLPIQYVHTLGDAHIYNNQLEVVKEMLSREPLDNDKQIKLVIKRKVGNIDDFKIEDFELQNYKQYEGYLQVPVAY